MSATRRAQHPGNRAWTDRTARARRSSRRNSPACPTWASAGHSTPAPAPAGSRNSRGQIIEGWPATASVVVSLKWPIGHRVANSNEKWPICLRTYCRDAAKVDKTRLATLTKVRRVGRTWQSSLQKSCSAIQWSSAAVPRFRLTSLTVHENFGLLHSRLAHIALTCGIDMPCAPTSLGYTRGRATQEDPSPMRLARGGLTYT